MSPLAKYVVETMVTLLGVVVLAVLVLMAARRIGVGRPAGPLSLVGRLPLDARRAIYLVRVGGTVYVVGASEAGLTKLGELSDDVVDLSELSEPHPAFADVLSRVLRKKPAEDEPESTKDKEG
jgi:flagellar protein FliO/FliZ